MDLKNLIAKLLYNNAQHLYFKDPQMKSFPSFWELCFFPLYFMTLILKEDSTKVVICKGHLFASKWVQILNLKLGHDWYVEAPTFMEATHWKDKWVWLIDEHFCIHLRVRDRGESITLILFLFSCFFLFIGFWLFCFRRCMDGKAPTSFHSR